MGTTDSKPTAGLRRTDTDRPTAGLSGVECARLNQAVIQGRTYAHINPPDTPDEIDFTPEQDYSSKESLFEIKSPKCRTSDSLPLPREIWEKIIFHLRMKVGQRVGERGRDEMQSHLTILMRVNKMLYSIAAPMLYTRVATLRPDLLVSHLDSRPISSDRLSKLELFQYIHHLNIEYDPSRVADERMLERPISDSDRTTLIKHGMFFTYSGKVPSYTTFEDLDLSVIRDMDIAYSATQSLEKIRNILPEGIKIFGNLKRITIGEFTKKIHVQQNYSENPRVDPILVLSQLRRYNPLSSKPSLKYLLSKKHQHQNELLSMRYRFGFELVSNCSSSSLEHICVDNFSGPLSIFTIPKIESLKSYTLHIVPSCMLTSHEEEAPPIIPGIINNWIIEDGSWERFIHTPKDGWTFKSTYQWLHYKMHLLEALSYADPKTKLKIYGALISPIIDREFPYLIDHSGVIPHSDDERSQKLRRNEILYYMGLPAKGFEGISLEDDVEGVCDACGYGHGSAIPNYT